VVGSTAWSVDLEPVLVGVQAVGRGESGEGLWTSAAGAILAWSSYDDSSDDRWLGVIDASGLRRIMLPDDAQDPSLDGSGRAVVYRAASTGEWRLRPLVVPDDTVIASGHWEHVRVAADGAIAARAGEIGAGRLCRAAAPPP
jgi:hypothetical protein